MKKVARRLLATALMLLCAGIAAQGIYRSVDRNGNIVFSDQPSSDSTLVKLPPIPTYSAPERRPGDRGSGRPAAAQAHSAGYTLVEIQQPARDATLRDNAGVVPVTVALEPQLDPSDGDRLQFYLDGQPQGGLTTDTSVSFSDVERGAHQVSVAVVDRRGRQLQRSASVTFYLHRESVNFPNRAPTPGNGP